MTRCTPKRALAEGFGESENLNQSNIWNEGNETGSDSTGSPFRQMDHYCEVIRPVSIEQRLELEAAWSFTNHEISVASCRVWPRGVS